LFEALAEALRGAGATGLAAAFAWGVLSVILSPCHLASIPLVVAFVSGRGRISTARAFGLSSLFAGGILVTIALAGAATALMGRVAGDLGSWVNYIVAAIFLLTGLCLLDVLKPPWTPPGNVAGQSKGAPAAFFMGLVFGIALGPCTFAFMVPVLAIAFKSAAEAPLYSAGLLTAYGAGHCLVIAAAGTSTELVQKYLDWNERSKGAVVLKKVCGLLIIAGGLYLIYVA
jgi:cytochrome c-type biogenesis protein